MLRALSVNGFPSLWAGRLDLRYFDFPNRRSCPGCSTRWSYLMHLLVEWEMYALYRDLVSRLLGEELSNEAAESPPRCSSNGGGVMRGLRAWGPVAPPACLVSSLRRSAAAITALVLLWLVG